MYHELGAVRAHACEIWSGDRKQTVKISLVPCQGCRQGVLIDLRISNVHPAKG